jgi:hypothetical protein
MMSLSEPILTKFGAVEFAFAGPTVVVKCRLCRAAFLLFGGVSIQTASRRYAEG